MDFSAFSICDEHVVKSDYEITIPNIDVLELCRRKFCQNIQNPAITELDSGRRVTYGQLDELIETLANILENLTLNEKEVKRVGLILPNCIEYVVFMLATWRIQASVVLINHLSSTEEMQRFLQMTSCDVIVTSERNESKVLNLLHDSSDISNMSLITVHLESFNSSKPKIKCEENNFICSLYVYEDLKNKKFVDNNNHDSNIINNNKMSNDTYNKKNVIDQNEKKKCIHLKNGVIEILYLNESHINRSIKNQTLCNNYYDKIVGNQVQCKSQNNVRDLSKEESTLMFSSGTSGTSKCVMVSHRNLVATIHFYCHPDIIANAEDMSNSIIFQPISHSYGIFRALVCLTNNINMLLMRKFNLKLYLKTIQQYKITSLQLVPPVAIMLCKSHVVKSYDVTSVGIIYCSAAPMGLQLENELKVIFNKNIKIMQGFGMTECTGLITNLPGKLLKTAINIPHGTVGKAYPNTEIVVVDPESGQSLGANQRGEFFVRGDQIMLGYLNNKVATEQTIVNGGWLRTGDLGYYDENNFFFIVDRLKELIKCKGFQVAPAELESILIEHPCVADVAVVGVYHPTFGEAPQAWIVRKEGLQDHECNEYQIMNWLAEKVSPFKKLSGGVKFVQNIPKSPSGKILRNQLREMSRIGKL